MIFKLIQNNFIKIKFKLQINKIINMKRKISNITTITTTNTIPKINNSITDDENIYIVLLKGINVGGNNSLKMELLRSILENLGATNCKTYIQSGNLVYKGNLIKEDIIASEIEKVKGFKPHVFIISLKEYELAILHNPFQKYNKDHKSVFLFFLSNISKTKDVDIDNIKGDHENYLLKDNILYLHSPSPKYFLGSLLASKLDKILNVEAVTCRNIKSIDKIFELANSLK
jgi:uncharacterized protein (DUF1697 family)